MGVRGNRPTEPEFAGRLTPGWHQERLDNFEAVMNGAALWMRGRERARTTAAMAMHEIRLPALELGRRGVAAGHLKSADHIFMLFAEELDDYLADPGRFTDLLAEREQTYLELFDYIPPFVVAGKAPDLSTWDRVDAQEVPALAAG